MGIGDSIGKAAENAMEDLAGTSDPVEKRDVPDPADPNSDVEVHSSLSEGSNAMDAEKQKAPGLKAGAAPGPVSESPFGGDVDDRGDDQANDDDGGLAGGASAPGGASGAAGSASAGGTGNVSGVAGGLPDSNPDELRADPTEGDQDPSTSTGRDLKE
jgi:hypothetical protein